MSDAVLRHIGIKEGSTTWEAVKYLDSKGHPLAAAVSSFRIPMSRIEPAMQRYAEALRMRREESLEVWAIARSMTPSEFERWWVERDHV